MKSTEVDPGLFSDSYCRVCSAQLISESQRVAHYESRKHANKVRLYYMLHPADGGVPAKKLRADNGGEEADVDRNKCCTLCNMSFTSAVVAQSHYQGKIHAKRLKLLLGEPPALRTKEPPPGPLEGSPLEGPPPGPLEGSPLEGSPLEGPPPGPLEGSPPGPLEGPPPGPLEGPPPAPPPSRGAWARCCRLCGAWFNHPGVAQQHYGGKKHRRNAGRARLLTELGGGELGPMRGLKRSYGCEVCGVTLNSVAQYHAHLQGSKHQNNLKNQICVQ